MAERGTQLLRYDFVQSHPTDEPELRPRGEAHKMSNTHLRLNTQTSRARIAPHYDGTPNPRTHDTPANQI